MRVHADFVGDEGHSWWQNHQAFGFPQVDGGVKCVVNSLSASPRLLHITSVLGHQFLSLLLADGCVLSPMGTIGFG